MMRNQRCDRIGTQPKLLSRKIGQNNKEGNRQALRDLKWQIANLKFGISTRVKSKRGNSKEKETIGDTQQEKKQEKARSGRQQKQNRCLVDYPFYVSAVPVDRDPCSRPVLPRHGHGKQRAN